MDEPRSRGVKVSKSDRGEGNSFQYTLITIGSWQEQ